MYLLLITEAGSWSSSKICRSVTKDNCCVCLSLSISHSDELLLPSAAFPLPFLSTTGSNLFHQVGSTAKLVYMRGYCRRLEPWKNAFLNSFLSCLKLNDAKKRGTQLSLASFWTYSIQFVSSHRCPNFISQQEWPTIFPSLPLSQLE